MSITPKQSIPVVSLSRSDEIVHFIQNREKRDIIFPDRLLWGHPGIAYGLLSDFYLDTETQSGVIFITNGSFEYAEGSSFHEIETDVFKVLFHRLKEVEMN